MRLVKTVTAAHEGSARLATGAAELTAIVEVRGVWSALSSSRGAGGFRPLPPAHLLGTLEYLSVVACVCMYVPVCALCALCVFAAALPEHGP
jgi:hypothetical protein